MDWIFDEFWENTFGRIADFFYFSATDKLVEALEALTTVSSFPLSRQEFFEFFYPVWGTSIVLGLLLGLWGAIVTLPSVFRSYGYIVTAGVQALHGFFVFIMGLILPPLMVALVGLSSAFIDRVLEMGVGSSDGPIIEGIIAGVLGSGLGANFFATIFAWILRFETLIIGVSVMPILILSPFFFALSVRERFVGLWRGWQAFMLSSILALPLIALILSIGLWFVSSMDAVWVALQADKVVVYAAFLAAIGIPFWLVRKMFRQMPAIVPGLFLSSGNRAALQSVGARGSTSGARTVGSYTRRIADSTSSRAISHTSERLKLAPLESTSAGAARVKRGMAMTKAAAAAPNPVAKVALTMVGAAVTLSGTRAAVKRVESERRKADV